VNCFQLKHDLFGKPEVHFSGSCSKNKIGRSCERPIRLWTKTTALRPPF
jgi:hypothetical protein